MVISEVTWRYPEPGEVRQAGEAIYMTCNGIVFKRPSCEMCARVVGVGWQEALFEGICEGCEVLLSGNV